MQSGSDILRFKSTFRFAVATAAVMGLVALAAPGALAMGSDNDQSSHTTAQSKKHDKKKSAAGKESNVAPIAEEPWRPDYRRAVAHIDRGEYAQAHAILTRLKHTGNADVLNYIGYSSRQLGDTETAETYYRAAIEANPNHIGAYEYYGELKVIQGNIDGARAYLAKVRQLCGGTNCEEYQELKTHIELAGGEAD